MQFIKSPDVGRVNNLLAFFCLFFYTPVGNGYNSRMKITHELRSWLKNELRSRAWTKRDLAKAAGVSEDAIGKIFLERQESITDKTLVGICRATAKSPRELLDISEGKHLVMEPQGRYEVSPDNLNYFVHWLQRQNTAVQEIIFATARLHGFEKNKK
ncbi:MAG: hypothetical protein A2X46_01925 [Lentisphaerae bacterium GWF2_57_35]|nr:MAG: hypothetical protein A2X46_01925 [Lentisphaerae bacterium GWF2_57_35]